MVDDQSRDRTVELARGLGIRTVVHEHNRGYGANQKTGFGIALDEGADIIVLLHPDYQYDPRLIPQLIEPITSGGADVVLGSRMQGFEAVRRGMPWYKFLGNIFLTGVENLVLRTRFSELHTGFRAYSRHALQAIPLETNRDGFVFDSEVIIELVSRGFRISEIHSPAMYSEESSSIGFWKSVGYGLGTLSVVFRFLVHRAGMREDEKFGRDRGPAS